jgi:hypothetical protein
MEIYQRPRSPVGFTKEGLENLTWIQITAHRLLSQKAFDRRGGVEKGAATHVFRFIAPNEIMENITHEWGEYDSIAGRLTQKASEINKTLHETKELVKGASYLIDQNKGGTTARSALSAVLQEKAIGIKVDSSLVYQNTNRREYMLTFELVDEGDPYNDIIVPIRELSRLSCAEIASDGQFDSLTGVDMPYVFRVESIPSGLINLENAACAGVQPTYHGPWKNGYPMRCEFQATFQELEPLYRYKFDGTGVVTTSWQE